MMTVESGPKRGESINLETVWLKTASGRRAIKAEVLRCRLAWYA